jgi:integrase
MGARRVTGTRRGNRESWIRQTPNARGYYEARVWMGTRADGKPDRRHIERKTLKAIRARVRELERKRDAGIAGSAGRARTVREMLTRHLEVVLPQRGRAPLTIRSYESLCREHVFPLWGGQKTDRLLPEHIEDGYAAMLGAGLSAGSVRKVHAILSSAYEIEVKRGNVARNPCRLVEAPRAGQGRKTALSARQARAVLTAVEGRRNASRWSVGLACGLRQGEALGLRWAFTDLGAGEMHVWWQLQRLPWRHGCADVEKCTAGRHRRPCPRNCPKAARKSGRRHVCVPDDAPRLCQPGCAGHAAQCPQRRGGGLVFREIKERRRKTVPLPPELVAALRKHRAAQSRERLAAANVWEDHDLVWCQENGRPIDSRADWQEWADILAEAGIPHAGVHAMRHSAATIALDEGVALAVVQELLGHSDIRVTREYTHVSSPLVRDGAERVGRALFGEK